MTEEDETLLVRAVVATLLENQVFMLEEFAGLQRDVLGLLPGEGDDQLQEQISASHRLIREIRHGG